MQEITLTDILEAREARVKIQKERIKKYSCPLICYTMNIAGPVKKTPEIERAFKEGINILKESLRNFCILNERIDFYDTGCVAYFSVKKEPNLLKDICVSIEEACPLGRLFDMDVLDENHSKLSRKKERGCIVCDSPGRACAAGRVHCVKELQNVTQKIIFDYFLKKDAEKIAELAKSSLIDEVNTTPKPGLVDKNNNGSHLDMNPELFIKSANVLMPYFRDCVLIGQKYSLLAHSEAFLPLKQAGIDAERKMLIATKNVNTHKGIIFSLGLICASIGRLYSVSKPICDLSYIMKECALLCEKSIYDDFKKNINTGFGSTLYSTHGIKGIRGEALSGFSSVTNISLPIFKNALLKGLNKNDAGVLALLHLIASIPDTNLYKRGGAQGFSYAKQYALDLIKKEKFTADDVKKADFCFIQKNLSPGGSADLLAVTYFLHSIISEYSIY